MNTQSTARSDVRRFLTRLALVGALAGAFAVLLVLGLQIQTRAAPRAVNVGLVTDEGTLDDPFNWLSYQGLLRAEHELGVVGTVYTSTGSADYQPNLEQCAAAGNDLCLAVGFSMADAISTVAALSPTVDFALVDASFESSPDNLRGLVFAADEVGYLAGTLAGGMTLSDVVGAVGGFPIPPVDDFLHGYRNGAQCANPTAQVLLTYTYDFVSQTLGARVAQELIAQDADVIFGAAGAAGAGAVLTATQSGVWGIGVDTDYYTTVFESGAVAGAEHLLSSALKRMDNAVFQTIEDEVSGAFSAGTVTYDLADGGVGLAPFHEADPWVPQSVRDELNAVRTAIISGTLDVGDPCRTTVYLPLTLRSYASPSGPGPTAAPRVRVTPGPRAR
jgi:basic membrane protein A